MPEEHDAIDFDFDEAPSTQEYVTVPPGTYLCRVDEARPGTTRSGHPRWGLKFVVHDGPETGRLAAWDGLIFSPKAAARTRQVLAALGLPHDGRVQLRPSDLVGRLALVRVEEGTFQDPDTGVKTRRNTVPYAGVRPAEPADGGNGRPEAEVPF